MMVISAQKPFIQDTGGNELALQSPDSVGEFVRDRKKIAFLLLLGKTPNHTYSFEVRQKVQASINQKDESNLFCGPWA